MWAPSSSKETLDNLRDRRTLLSSFSLSVLSPVLFVGLMVFILDQAARQERQQAPRRI